MEKANTSIYHNKRILRQDTEAIFLLQQLLEKERRVALAVEAGIGTLAKGRAVAIKALSCFCLTSIVVVNEMGEN